MKSITNDFATFLSFASLRDRPTIDRIVRCLDLQLIFSVWMNNAIILSRPSSSNLYSSVVVSMTWPEISYEGCPPTAEVHGTALHISDRISLRLRDPERMSSKRAPCLDTLPSSSKTWLSGGKKSMKTGLQLLVCGSCLILD